MEEPECYDSIRVHAEWGQSTQDNEKKPTFAVCVCVGVVGGDVLTCAHLYPLSHTQGPMSLVCVSSQLLSLE